MFTRIALALFGQLPWRGVPYIPVEIMLLPRWFPFNLHKISYWSRTVMVPLLDPLHAQSRAPAIRARSDILELFTTPPEQERHYFRRPAHARHRWRASSWRSIGWPAASIRLIPAALRARAMRRAEAWILERLNGEDGLGAIFPAMVNALEVLAVRGYPRR